MAKLLASTIGVLFLNPVACSGTPGPGNGQDSGVGGSMSTGGSSAETQCSTREECAPNQICVQVMFPIMPPPGYGGMTMGNAKFGICKDMGSGGAAGTGGIANTGGTSHDLNTSAGGKTMKPPMTGGSLGTGGATSRTPCNVATADECLPNEKCEQVIFPIMPPDGYGGGVSDVKLGECVPIMHSLNTGEPQSSSDEDTWWQTAESLLRRT